LLTDGNSIVVKLLQKNQDFIGNTSVHVAKLLWGMKTELENVISSTIQEYPDVIIGADVVLWPNQIGVLLYSIRWMLMKKEHCSCYISYIVRANLSTALLHSTAEKLGLTIRAIPADLFVPHYVRDFDSLEKQLLHITLNKQATAEMLNDDSQLSNYLNNIASSSMPC
jgi:hypothetical protein